MYLPDFVDDFCDALQEQINKDQERWGDTWRHRPIEGQVDRMMDRFRDYQDRHNNANQPMPWLKIAGESLIGWVRENNPDYYIGDEDA